MESRWISWALLALLLLGTTALILAVHYTSPLVNLISRTPGGPHSEALEASLGSCNGSDPSLYGYGACSLLINCIYANVSEVAQADMANGSGIVGLLPTILLLIAPTPLELVQQGLVAPHRALATAGFSIGLPTSLFGRLRPVRPHFWALEGKAANRKVHWEVALPVPSSGNRRRVAMACRLTVDLTITACAGIMLWRSWVVSTWVMVTWMCQSPILQFAWPIGCMLWMSLALLLLHAMSKDIRFENAKDSSIVYTWGEVLLLPYTLDFERKSRPPFRRREISQQSMALSLIDARDSERGESTGPGQAEEALSNNNPPHREAATEGSADNGNTELDVVAPAADRGFSVRITVEMPQEHGFLSWMLFETVIESLSAALYFYGTFVWTSALFLNPIVAMEYVVTVVACYMVLRVLSTLF